MNTITRKTMLYKTGVEYGDYTMNHVLGCSHGCTYPCYAYMMAKRFGKVVSQDDWRQPRLVSNTLEILDKEIPRLRDKIHSVQLCFTTDPFMVGYDEVADMSIAAIKKLNNAGIRCITLTKGVTPVEVASLSQDNEYGITLVSLDDAFRQRFEPYAASATDRLAALRYLHEHHCQTWVSIEPYPTPNIINQNLDELLDAVGFVDRIVFGRMNYSKLATAYSNRITFYNSAAACVIRFCEHHGIQYHIKNGTIVDL